MVIIFCDEEALEVEATGFVSSGASLNEAHIASTSVLEMLRGEMMRIGIPYHVETYVSSCATC